MWWPYTSLERLCIATYLSIWVSTRRHRSIWLSSNLWLQALRLGRRYVIESHSLGRSTVYSSLRQYRDGLARILRACKKLRGGASLSRRYTGMHPQTSRDRQSSQRWRDPIHPARISPFNTWNVCPCWQGNGQSLHARYIFPLSQWVRAHSLICCC